MCHEEQVRCAGVPSSFGPGVKLKTWKGEPGRVRESWQLHCLTTPHPGPLNQSLWGWRCTSLVTGSLGINEAEELLQGKS